MSVLILFVYGVKVFKGGWRKSRKVLMGMESEGGGPSGSRRKTVICKHKNSCNIFTLIHDKCEI